ncbi:MAG: glutamate--tRNA ligase [Christensenellales bacterium]|jgi:glutamyl-tRNA synthetase
MKEVRTRFAPSPTGYMHIGNLRTALYAFLFARHEKGKFILRIEDTDQKRFVEGSTELIYTTLKQTNLLHDEGPDIGGNFGPYVQSERKHIYKEYAEKLVQTGHAYYCFCSNNKDEENQTEPEQTFGYNRHCRNLTKEEIAANLQEGKPYVIRQAIPLEGTTTFHDEVYGDITVENNSLDDQILLKGDGMPTYNFANVVDDHLMDITHVIRGKEYISSTPKYQLLYNAFGWESPKTVHLSTIMGQNPDGSVSKLSKRHGAVSFAQLLEEGYLGEAILNYIALLGWSPKQEREVFSLDELIELFDISGVVKTNAIFNYQKLDWFNAIYISNMSHDEFLSYAKPYTEALPQFIKEKWLFASTLAQSRISKFSDIAKLFAFLTEYTDFDLALFENKKNKLEKADSLAILKEMAPILNNVEKWEVDDLNAILQAYTDEKQIKIGRTMWPVRIAVTGQVMTPGGGAEMLYLLGKEESLARINHCIARLEKELN